jgi:hypothetical protein
LQTLTVTELPKWDLNYIFELDGIYGRNLISLGICHNEACTATESNKFHRNKKTTFPREYCIASKTFVNSNCIYFCKCKCLSNYLNNKTGGYWGDLCNLFGFQQQNWNNFSNLHGICRCIFIFYFTFQDLSGLQLILSPKLLFLLLVHNFDIMSK